MISKICRNAIPDIRNKTVGIFVAPLIHMRNENTMKSVLNNYNLDMICLTDKEFINIIKSDNIYNELDNLTKKISNVINNSKFAILINCHRYPCDRGKNYNNTTPGS